MADNKSSSERSGSSNGKQAASNQPPDVGGTASDAARAIKDEVNNQAQQVTSTARDAAGLVADSAKDAATSVAQTVRQQAGQVTNQATVAAMTGAAQVKDNLADTLEKAADAVSQSGQNLPRPEWVQPVEGGLRTGANYLRERDIDTLTDDFVQLVRRRPLQMLLGAFVFGYLLGKALRGDNGNDIWDD